MRRSIYYFTMSLDGFIADGQGLTTWLAGAPNTDYGFKEFYAEVDTIMLGRHTYEQMLDKGDFFPYADKEVVVCSANEHLRRAAESVRIESAPAEKVLARLQLGQGGAIWIGGGAHLAGSLYGAGLLDEVRVFVQPIVLGGGLSFFAGENLPQRPLELVTSKEWPAGLQELHYQIPKRWRTDV